MEIKVINNSAFSLPSYETQGSAGMDIKANIPSAVFLAPLERRLIPTGLFIEIPQGFECQIRPRSGLALKKGIGVLNSPGTIDSDYRGDIGVILYNTDSNSDFEVKIGDKIAQIIIEHCSGVHFVQTGNLPITKRGEGGYGHTG